MPLAISRAGRRLSSVSAHLRSLPPAAAAVPSAAEDAGQRSVEFLRSLVRVQTEIEEGEPCPGENAVQRVISARLAELGCSVTDMRYNAESLVLRDEFAEATQVQVGERVSVIGHKPAAPGGGGRSLILFAHPDGEAVGGTERWSQDPFAGDLVDGRVYGWGVADDLMGVAAGVCALDVLASQGTELRGDVMMCSTPSKRNANGVTAVMQNMELAGTADAALYLHPAESGAGLQEIKAIASGQLKFKITCEGMAPNQAEEGSGLFGAGQPTTEPGHAAFAHLAVNAIDKALLCACPHLPAFCLHLRLCQGATPSRAVPQRS